MSSDPMTEPTTCSSAVEEQVQASRGVFMGFMYSAQSCCQGELSACLLLAETSLSWCAYGSSARDASPMHCKLTITQKMPGVERPCQYHAKQVSCDCWPCVLPWAAHPCAHAQGYHSITDKPIRSKRLKLPSL